MKKARLTKEEQEILRSYNAGEWRSIPEQDLARYRKYAESALRKNKRINIRISEPDLEALQKRAIEEGIPYQTLISSILHKYVSGRLEDRKRK